MADTPIEKLTIELNAESENANKAIDNLISKIDNLARSLSSVKGDGATGAIDGVEKHSQKAALTLNQIADKYKDLGKGFKLRGSADYLQKQVDGLYNSLAKAAIKKQDLETTGKTGGKMYEYAVRDTIKFSNQIKGLEEQLKELSEIKISPQLEEAIKRETSKGSEYNLQSSETPKAVKVSAESLGYNQSAIEFIENYSTKAEVAVKNLAENLKQLVVPEVKEENLAKLESAIAKTEEKLEKLKAKLANGLILGTVTESADNSAYVRIGEQIALTEKELEALQAKKAEVEKSSSGNGFGNFKKMLSSIGSTAKTVLSKVLNLAKGITTLSHRTRKSNTSFAGGIKTILKYGLGIRSLYTLFNKLRNGIKEGIKNLVQFSSETNASVSLLNNSFTQLKNSTASMAAPLLNALAPALNTIIQWCVKATNAVNQLISALTGKSTWIKAKTLTDDYASSLDNANASANKLKTTTLGIDELNISSKDDSSGSGTSATDMFEYEDITSKWANIADWLKEMWEDADFTELGTVIGNKLKNVLEGISWDKVYDGAKNFGKSFATFLNGLISPELFGAVGQTIAGALNTAIYAALSFGEKFDFYDFGVSIATGINDFFGTFDFESLGETLNTWVDGLKDAIAGFLDTITWSKILEATTTFLGTLKLDTVEVLIGAFLIKNSALNLANLLGSALLGKFALSVTIPELLLSISSFSLGNMSGASFQVIGTQIVEKIETAMEELLPEGVAQSIGGALGGASVGAIAGSWIPGVGTLVGAIVGAIVGGFANNESFMGTMSKWWKNNVSPWFTKEKWKKLWENIKKALKEKWDEIVEWWKNSAIVKWWNENVKPWFTKEKWKTEFENIKKALKEKWDEIVEWWKNSAIVKWWNENVKPWFTKEKWIGIMSNVPTAFKETFKKAANTAIGIFNNLIDWINKKLHIEWEAVRILGKTIIPSMSVQLFTIPHIPQFEDGGFPQRYSLFMAGENGVPELAGTVGGKTAVAGGAEITGISNAVYSTSEEELRELREMNSLLRQLLEKDTSVNIGDREIYKASVRGSKSYGRLLVT